MRNYLTVIVERDPMEKIPATIPAHEGPILGIVHGIEEPQIVDRFSVEPSEGEDDEFEAKAEYERLVAKYGHHPDNKLPYVAMAYGQLAEGRFAKALKAAHGKAIKQKDGDKTGAKDDDENE